MESEERRGVVGQWEDERESYAEPVLAHVGPAFDAGRSEGLRMPIDQAVEYALASVD